MERHAELNHLVGGDAFALVLGVRQARVGQVEASVEFLRRERRVGRIDHHPHAFATHTLSTYHLQESLSMNLVALLLDVSEILGMKLRLSQAILEAVQHDVVLPDAARYLFFFEEPSRLRQFLCRIAQHFPRDAGVAILVVMEQGMKVVDGFVESLHEFQRRLLAHAIRYQVGIAVTQNAWAKALLPIVVVHHAPEACFNAAEHNGNIGKELPQDVGIDDGGVLGTQVVTPIGTVRVLASEATGSGVFVDHAVHASRRDAEEEPRSPQLLEVAEVAVPIGLRHDADPQTHFFACCGKPIGLYNCSFFQSM